MADTTIWCNFAFAGLHAAPLLAFPGVVSPPAVLEELAAGLRLGHLPELDLAALSMAELYPPEVAFSEGLRARLGRGEAEALALARGRHGLLLTDDRAARRAASDLQVPCSGTLGALVRLVEQGHSNLPEAEEALQRMLQAGYRCPVQTLKELL